MFLRDLEREFELVMRMFVDGDAAPEPFRDLERNLKLSREFIQKV